MLKDEISCLAHHVRANAVHNAIHTAEYYTEGQLKTRIALLHMLSLVLLCLGVAAGLSALVVFPPASFALESASMSCTALFLGGFMTGARADKLALVWRVKESTFGPEDGDEGPH